jgi:hypothetical protein
MKKSIWQRLERDEVRKRTGIGRYEVFNDELYFQIIKSRGGFLKSTIGLSWEQQVKNNMTDDVKS